MNQQEIEFKGKDLVEKCISKLKAEMMSPRTIKKYRSHLGLILRYLGKHPMEITMEDIENWRYEMAVNRKYEPETQWTNMVILRKFLRYIEKNELADKMTMPKRPTHTPPEKEIWLLPNEEKAMIEKSKQMGTRAHAVIRLFLSTGIRAEELRQLDITDVNFEKKLIHIRHAKGDKSKISPTDTETKKAIIEYLKDRKTPTDGSNALFVTQKGNRPSYKTILSTVKNCRINAGINKNITCHKLRHTFITRVIEETKDIPLAQKLAGHSNIKTTMRYHHTTYEEVEAKYRYYFDRTNDEEHVDKGKMRNDPAYG